MWIQMVEEKGKTLLKIKSEGKITKIPIIQLKKAIHVVEIQNTITGLCVDGINQ